MTGLGFEPAFISFQNPCSNPSYYTAFSNILGVEGPLWVFGFSNHGGYIPLSSSLKVQAFKKAPEGRQRRSPGSGTGLGEPQAHGTWAV